MILKENTSQGISRFLEKIKVDRKFRHTVIIMTILISAALFVCIFASNNESFYNKPIAKITSIDETSSKSTDVFGYSEDTYAQKIHAIIMNGKHKDEKITFNNAASYSQAFDFKFKINDEVFISIKEDELGGVISASADELKRDKYIVFVAVVFILSIILIGKAKGIMSLISLIFNIALVLIIIELFSKGIDILLLSVIATIAFVITTILLVSGIKKNSVSAIISTFIATAFSMAIAIAVMLITKSKGVFYEEMEFITSNSENIFIAQILIGNLGGIMDIAVSLSSAIKEMYNVNPDIGKSALVKSAKNIGSDIMGTMANTLIFAYISGSLPIILLLLKNGYSPFYIIQNNISLEMIRALAGSIGMVISIPISWHIAISFLKKKKGMAE